MATLKHINSKNADYGAAEQYLLFEHDEFTMKPVLDENGRLIPREDYRLSTLNCGGEDFAVACMRSNLRYEKNQRREDVKSHHYIISFDPRDGPDNGLTVDRAQALGEQFCKEHFPGHQALVCTHPDGHNHSGNIHVHIGAYSIIYADPPWRYSQKGLQGAAEHHYPTMSIDELCALPVADLAAPDSALFLWATFPQLPEALRLIREWGFTYKSVAFVWLKKNRKADSWFYGLGFWTRANAEVCLLATRGHPKRQAANIHQFIISPIEAHSKKPDEARDKIVALMGDLPRVELFARQTPPGWDVWGNEVQSMLRDFGTNCPKEGG